MDNDEHNESSHIEIIKVIYRLDERTLHLQKDIHRIAKLLERQYVHSDEFRPVKNVVYGMVAAVALSVVGGILRVVLVN